MTDKPLSTRVERATEPDRELDAEIAVAVSGDAQAFIARPSPLSIFTHKPGWWADGEDKSHCAPSYMSSIDAAMTLVPEGASIKLISHPGEHHCEVYRLDHSSDALNPSIEYLGESEQCATPALALTAACLRARGL